MILGVFGVIIRVRVYFKQTFLRIFFLFGVDGVLYQLNIPE